ncbi:hypothetical protein GF369_01130 [Candidatus Peregrinibacteria bacterium]|nr:hypothetical protein [Candidatus Peregrinibacteria bacterium]
MPAQRIQDKIKSLPTAQKLIGIGSVIAIISSFLTWYRDIDAFDRGGAYLGITGPLYLIGYIIICLSAFALALTVFHVLEKKVPSLPIKESMVYILSGATSIFLLILANSIYFHPQFGLNITSKEYGLGMMLAFIGSVAVTIGGVLQNRERGTSRLIKEFQQEARSSEKEADPVVELNNFQKEQERRKQSLEEKAEHKKREDIASKRAVQQEEKPTIKPQSRQYDGGRVYKAKSEAKPEQTSVRQEPYPDVSKLRRERHDRPVTDKKEEKKVNPNSVIRMDL